MSDTETVPEFGCLPFDQFIIALWDPTSPLSKQDQKRTLLNKWVRLGKYGRNSHMQPDIPYPEDIPAHIPRDLLTDSERTADGQMPRVLFTRTWFGLKDDKASQDAADAGYARLKEYVLGNEVGFLLEGCIFDNSAEFNAPPLPHAPEGESEGESEGQGQDINDDGIALGTPGSVPSYLVAALMHCPDMLDGASDEEWRHYSPEEIQEAESEEKKDQSVLVVVGDRKACEEGWVLCLAVNHKGRILPFRVREKALEVGTQVSNWMEGQPLDEIADDPDDEVEFYLREGSGWE